MFPNYMQHEFNPKTENTLVPCVRHLVQVCISVVSYSLPISKQKMIIIIFF